MGFQHFWDARYVLGGVGPQTSRHTMQAANSKPYSSSGAYCVVIVLNFVFRIARINQDGLCVIGMERRALLPLIIFDLVVNVCLRPTHAAIANTSWQGLPTLSTR